MDATYGREMFATERRPIRHLDVTLLLTTLALSVIGLFMVYSATYRSLQAQQLDPGTYLKRQIVWALFGVILLLLCASFDYRFVKTYAGFIYGAMLLSLVFVRSPLGTSVKGSQRWFEFLGFQFTPSEYMKIAVIVMLAAYLAELRTTRLSLDETLRVTAIAAFPMLLVFLQPDVGTTIVICAILVGTLVVAGARPRHLAVLALSAVVLIFLAFQMGVVKDYQIARLIGWLDPSSDPQSAGYNKAQAEIAVGSGGLAGRGYLHGTQTNLDFVPEQHTDFIFTVVGEEFGFLGAMFVVALFGVLVWRAFRIALLSKDPFGTYLAAGIASMFAIEVFVNVGMSVGIMPITGIPLPFVSYGGSAMMANYIAIGLLLNVHMRRFK